MKSGLPNPVSITPADLVELLRRVTRKDKVAFAALYSATSAKLYGIILRILSRRDLADEILQEVFVTIWQHAGDFDPGRASPVSWMAAIARNRALDEVRRQRPLALDDMPEALQVADAGLLASDIVEQSDEFRRLEKCLGSLDIEKRDIVKLAYLGGWSREQLATRYRQPVPTIKNWLRRSLMQLKDCLKS